MIEKANRYFKIIINKVKDPKLRILPGQLAFFTVISLVPLLTLIILIASSLSLPYNEIVGFSFLEIFSANTEEVLLENLEAGLNFNMIMFFVVAFILASNGPHSIILISNEIYNTKAKSFIKRRAKAILMTLILVMLVLILLLVPLFGNLIKQALIENNSNNIETFTNIYLMIKYPITIILIFINVKILYLISADVKIKPSSTTKGAIFTTICWIIATEIYSFYVGMFSDYNLFYGSISNLIIALIWIYIISYIFVLGLAFNAASNRKGGNTYEAITKKN